MPIMTGPTILIEGVRTLPVLCQGCSSPRLLVWQRAGRSLRARRPAVAQVTGALGEGRLLVEQPCAGAHGPLDDVQAVCPTCGTRHLDRRSDHDKRRRL